MERNTDMQDDFSYEDSSINKWQIYADGRASKENPPPKQAAEFMNMDEL